jgi:hypothetical protein
LLDHLLIPVGADLTIEVDLPSPPDQGPPPKFLDNLRNLPNFTDILYTGKYSTRMQFSGPNGQVTMVPRSSRVDKTRLMLESLDQFDTSKVEWLKIDCGNLLSSGSLYRALLSMKRLCTLTLHHCTSSNTFVSALHPDVGRSGVIVCPKLEELDIVLDRETVDVKNVIGVVAMRASRGAKLKSIRIVRQGRFAPVDVLELKKHVLDVECGPEADGADDDNDDIDEED